uniref:Uncharacterized protein n=1 Tax=Anguilla anguilla TaxID=7936 RepID=A0A0E9UTC6_ANGAN
MWWLKNLCPISQKKMTPTSPAQRNNEPAPEWYTPCCNILNDFGGLINITK